VVAAAQAAFGENAEVERSAPMGTGAMQEAQAPAEVAEEDQLFAEDAHGQRYIAQLAGDRDRLPEAP
jgi:hypothetical protein